MDGNGRRAGAHGQPRTEGHRHGADAVRRAVEAAPGLGIATLTLYASSADNWRRPAALAVTLLSSLILVLGVFPALPIGGEMQAACCWRRH